MNAELLKIGPRHERSLYVFYPYQTFYDYHFVNQRPGMRWENLKAGECCIALFGWKEFPTDAPWMLVFFRGKFGFILSHYLVSL